MLWCLQASGLQPPTLGVGVLGTQHNSCVCVDSVRHRRCFHDLILLHLLVLAATLLPSNLESSGEFRSFREIIYLRVNKKPTLTGWRHIHVEGKPTI